MTPEIVGQKDNYGAVVVLGLTEFIADIRKAGDKGATDAMIRLGYDTNIAYGTTAYDVSLLQQAFSDHWQNVNRGAIMAFSRTGAVNAPTLMPK